MDYKEAINLMLNGEVLIHPLGEDITTKVFIYKGIILQSQYGETRIFTGCIEDLEKQQNALALGMSRVLDRIMGG